MRIRMFERCRSCGRSRPVLHRFDMCLRCWERIPAIQRALLYKIDSRSEARRTVLADQLANGVTPECIVVPR